MSRARIYAAERVREAGGTHAVSIGQYAGEIQAAYLEGEVAGMAAADRLAGASRRWHALIELLAEARECMSHRPWWVERATALMRSTGRAGRPVTTGSIYCSRPGCDQTVNDDDVLVSLKRDGEIICPDCVERIAREEARG